MVMSAGRLRGEFGQCPVLVGVERLPHGPERGLVDLDPRRLEFAERAHPDPPHHDPVHRFSGQGRQGLAHAVGVVLVRVDDRLALERLGVHDHEDGGRSEMAADGAFKPFVLLYR